MSSERLVTVDRRGDSGANYHCCVPMCAASARFNSVLSFHAFPRDEDLQRTWVVNIRPDNVAINKHARVCSRHFKSTDLIEPPNAAGRRRLRDGAVPVLFEWNGFTSPAAQPWVCKNNGQPNTDTAENTDSTVVIHDLDHDYCSTAEPAAPKQTEYLPAGRRRRRRLQKQMEQVAISNRFCLERFSASDDSVRFYTRFASHAHLMAFWRHIEPETYRMVREGTQAVAETNEVPHTGSGTPLQLIDEFLLFMTYLSLGPTQEELAHMFRISQSAVSPIINTWANFLYSVLGVVGIWMSEAKVKAQLPYIFKDYSDTQVVLACTELHCQTPSSLLLQGDVLSTYKSHCTFKGLIGLAPHGAVTFVSALYASSISDKELLKQSGIVSLLKPTMAIMVDGDFLAEDCVPYKVYIPALLSNRAQLSVPKIGTTKSVAKLRGYVKALVQRVKEHKIFSGVIPLSLTCSINQLYTVACLLKNYQNMQSRKYKANKCNS